MNFIWALLYNCKSSLFYWIFHWTFVIGGRKVLLKQTSQNLKVMNSFCFVTVQTKVHMKGDLGTMTVWVLCRWSLPQPALALSVSESPPAPLRGVPSSSHHLLGVHILAPAQWEHRHCLWEQPPVKRGGDKILCLQDSSQAEQCPVELFLQNAFWNVVIPALVSSSHTAAVPRSSAEYCWSLPRVSAGLSRCCWVNSSVWSWGEMSPVVHFALEMSSSVWGVNILGL